MKKEIAGQPVWLWAVGAGVVVLGYWYFSRKAGTGGSAQPGGGQYKATDNLKEQITSWQGPPSKPPPKPKPPPKGHHHHHTQAG